MLSGLSHLDDTEYPPPRQAAPVSAQEPPPEPEPEPEPESEPEPEPEQDAEPEPDEASGADDRMDRSPADEASAPPAAPEAPPPEPEREAPALAVTAVAAFEPAEPVKPVLEDKAQVDLEDMSSDDLDQVKADLASITGDPEPAPIPEPEPEVRVEPEPEPDSVTIHAEAPASDPVTPETERMGSSAAAIDLAAHGVGAGDDTPVDVAPSVDLGNEKAAGKTKSFLARFGAKPAPAEPAKDMPDDQSPAMSAEREVELDADVGASSADPQTAIDHAIAVLDREAKGQHGALDDPKLQTIDPELADVGFAQAEAEDEGGSSPALTIFLVLVLLLLAGAGGAGYWAWREGYLDLSNTFGADAAIVSPADTAVADTTPETPASTATNTTPRVIESGDTTDEASRPGNTAAMPDVVETPETGLEQSTAPTNTPDAALALQPSDAGTAPSATMDGTEIGNTASDAATGLTTASGAVAGIAEPETAEDKIDERLPVAEETVAEATAEATPDAVVVPDVVTEGSQSLLLEASDEANAGAIPFSGTVDWSRGVDELGQRHSRRGPTFRRAI